MRSLGWLCLGIWLLVACGGSGGSDVDGGGGGGDADTSADTDGDGITDGDEGRFDPNGPVDTDGDGTPDYQDDDSDGDGIPDAEERGGAPGSPPRDFDGDGTPDFRDLDSDDDGIGDRIEGSGDTDGDGFGDYVDLDSDGDGIGDSIEGTDGSIVPVDTDGDGVFDFRDLDTDGDGMPDEAEGTEDWDGDGIPNWRDPRNDGPAQPITLTAISTAFNQPIGIDYHEPTNSIVMTVNYSEGIPLNFERVEADGTHEPFSAVSGFTNEVKIATARSGNPGGFTAGDLFVGNGVDGQIVRITDDGATVINPWVDLPGAGNGLMRGSLYVDRTGLWAGDLVVCTTTGQVWRIDNAGAPTMVANVGVHLEGLIVVPDAPVRFGPISGKAIAGAEGSGLMYAFSTDGTFETYNVGVAIEDIDLIAPNENYFGVNFGTSRLLGAAAEEFQPIAGDILLTMETVTAVGLYRLHWDGSQLAAPELTLTAESAIPGQWEHVTFAPAGIVEIPPID